MSEYLLNNANLSYDVVKYQNHKNFKYVASALLVDYFAHASEDILGIVMVFIFILVANPAVVASITKRKYCSLM